MAENNRAGNWIAVSRDMRDHPIVGFGRRPKAADPTNPVCYSYGEGFIDLLMWARFEDGEVRNKGRKMLIRRGQLMTTLPTLAKRWNWTVKTVRGFLRTLSNDTMISTSAGVEREETGLHGGSQSRTRGGNLCSILTICNYDNYQPSAARAKQPNEQAKGSRGAGDGQPRGSNIILKQGNNGKGREDSSCGSTAPAAVASGRHQAEDQFEVFWKAFPADRKRDKGDCRDLFCAIVLGQHRKRRATAEQIIAAVKAGRGIDPDYAPMPATWLNGGRWEDDEVRGQKGNARLSAERQRELADKAIKARTWPQAYKAGPHSPECLFTDPEVRQQLRAVFNPANQFIGTAHFNNATHPAAGQEVPF